MGEELRVKESGLGRDVEKMASSLTDTTKVRNEAIERSEDLTAQLAASVHREEAHKLDLTAMKEDLSITRVRRANLRWLVNKSVS